MASQYHYKPNGEVPPGEQLPPGVRRYALGVEYCGARLHGFQKQRSASRTVQAFLEQALSSIAAMPTAVVCAGRTDAGVHATNQVVHFDTSAQRPLRAWVQGVNTLLPDEVRVGWAAEVAPQFHARFSATARSYRYLIHSAPVRSALSSAEVTWTRHPLDLGAMRRGAAHLLGCHDFTSFRASQCQARNPVREITRLDIAQLGPLIVLEIRANAFLHHMVRNISGALMSVGRRERAPEWIAEVLAARDRTRAGVTAPPFGLYLVEVEYPEEFPLPRRAPGPLLVPLPLGGLPLA
ncbi:tRNA pseudouridine(38-40) synthase TruA [Microbulbifer discodermiae]|uniref:tRNA pseudouridine(38-40) synthase TruA n=1 Tax=Microbulbifer sp. 2201CG32-9 TaxID=3232309 RepID=UPI00345B74C7